MAKIKEIGLKEKIKIYRSGIKKNTLRRVFSAFKENFVWFFFF